MKVLNKVICLLVILLTAVSIKANTYNMPKRIIGGTEFYCYKVTAKETIFGISNKLNISQEDLKKYNPSIINGLKKDYVLLIPANLIDAQNNWDSSLNTNSAITHIVQKGETLYGISKTYSVSQDDIIALNPDASKGLKTGTSILIPQPNQQQDNSVVYHTIKKGDTLYNLSVKYDTSIENILSLNPGVSPTNFKIDDVIKIEPNTLKTEVKEATTTTFEAYVVQDGDSYKKIAKENNVDVDDLKASNPNIDKIKPGKTIQIPIITTDSVTIAIIEESESELNENSMSRITEIYDSIHNVKDGDDVKIALLLPYMLNEQVPGKQANLYTEFYKGFLMAVDEMKNQCNGNLEIYTFDTKDNIDELNTILDKPEMKEMSLIFAPNETNQLQIISQFCQENKIYLVNAFSMKTEDYNTNPYMFQVNIPQSFLYADVYDWFDEMFNQYNVVFVHKKDSTKKDFADELRAHIEQKGDSVKFVEYTNVLKSEMLSAQADSLTKTLFIPTSASKVTMSNLFTAVKKLNNERYDIVTSILGYPEWVTYMNVWKNDFHATDTYFYSRFFANPDGYNVKLFEREFSNWYGEKLINAAPCFGYLGYDLGRYFIKALCCEDGLSQLDTIYDGLQSNFNFERISNWSGYINKSTYFIHFTQDNEIEIDVR